MRITFSPIKEEKSRLLISCTLGQEMWTKMETAYSESAADSFLLLWSQFYGCKFLPLVILDDQIIVKVTMSLPPSLKLIFKAEWESAVTAERTLRNLTTRLVQMEKEINESEKESDALLSKRVKTLRSLPSPMSNPLNSELKKKGGGTTRACWECGDTSNTRSNCRDYKRKLKRQREDEDDDRSRRWKPKRGRMEPKRQQPKEGGA
jgi:hypothetical protein